MDSLTYQERTALVLKYGLEDGNPMSSEDACLVLGVKLERLRQIRRGAMIKMRSKACRNQLEGLLCN